VIVLYREVGLGVRVDNSSYSLNGSSTRRPGISDLALDETVEINISPFAGWDAPGAHTVSFALCGLGRGAAAGLWTCGLGGAVPAISYSFDEPSGPATKRAATEAASKTGSPSASEAGSVKSTKPQSQSLFHSATAHTGSVAQTASKSACPTREASPIESSPTKTASGVSAPSVSATKHIEPTAGAGPASILLGVLGGLALVVVAAAAAVAACKALKCGATGGAWEEEDLDELKLAQIQPEPEPEVEP
jgi:hypothetical protein